MYLRYHENFLYNFTIGPIGFSLLCEVSATHFREKTIAFLTAVQVAVGTCMTGQYHISLTRTGRL